MPSVIISENGAYPLSPDLGHFKADFDPIPDLYPSYFVDNYLAHTGGLDHAPCLYREAAKYNISWPTWPLWQSDMDGMNIDIA